MFRREFAKHSYRHRRGCKKLVEHLKKNNLGRASFLPITAVKEEKIESIKGKRIGVIGIASDLVKLIKSMNKLF